MENTFIYALSDPKNGEVKYIGKSNNPKKRYIVHFFRLNRVFQQKNDWIDGLVKDGLKPTLDVLDEVLMSEWAFWEKHYISLYRSWGFKLLNVTDGGGCDRTGAKMSDANKKALSDRQKKRFSDPLQRKKLSDKNTGHKHTVYTKLKMSRTHKERMKNNPEIASRIGDYRKRLPKEKMDIWAKNMSKIQKEKLKDVDFKNKRVSNLLRGVEKNKKSVVKYDLKNNIVEVYPSMADAARNNGMLKASISRCISGYSKTSGGFSWKLKDK